MGERGLEKGKTELEGTRPEQIWAWQLLKQKLAWGSLSTCSSRGKLGLTPKTERGGEKPSSPVIFFHFPVMDLQGQNE